MAKANANAEANAEANAGHTIDALLQQRAQYEQWLARLDATSDKASTAVRDRVRGDYEGRLSRVIDELRGHAATIAEELNQHRAEQGRLDAERRTAEETLSEAEVRHVVGEYTEDEWQRLSGESQRHLDGLRGQLLDAGAEIARLAEVQMLIESPSLAPEPEPEPEPMMPAAPVARNTPIPVPTPVATVSAQVSMPLDTVAPIPAAGPPEPVLAGPADELAFLRSVADEEQQLAEPPSRRSGHSGAGASKVAAEPAATSTAVPAPTPSAPAPAPASVAPGAGAGKAAGMAKTLKCNECGTFNRPTEWYCERCGAELAAL